MPVLEILFPAGRYHATAWGRNVNEGEPEWPPSPFRLARALVDMRFRRHADIGDEQLQDALLLLGGSPRFSLPPFGKSTVKYYQDQGKNPLERQPVLDAFVCVGKEDALYMELPMARSEALRTLEKLLLSLPYLGRSESWISARVCDSLPDRRAWNCVPVAHSVQLEEMLHVQTLLDPRQYDLLPYLPYTGAGRKKRHCTWLEALTLSTSTLLKNGWNRHPLLGQCTYAMTVEEHPSVPQPSTQEGPVCVTYAIRSMPLLKVTQTLFLADRVRAALMSRHKQCCGNDPARVSQLFSGKDADGKPLIGHRHAYYWPCDTDRDGKIDHVRIFLPRTPTQDERHALEDLRKIWVEQRDLAELVFLHCLPEKELPTARIVVSATPVVFGRHYKSSKGSPWDWVQEETRRACRDQGLPEPMEIEPLPFLPVRNGALFSWPSFRTQRKGEGFQQAFGLRLRFAEPVPVPFALGSLAHFGLGLFVAG